MSGRSWLVAVVLAVGLGSGRAEAASASFKDWTVVCDNVRHCTAFGFQPDGDDDLVFLKVERDGASGAAPRLSLAIGDEDLRGKVWAVALDGQPMPQLAKLKAKNPAESYYPEVALGSADAALLLGKLPNGQEIQVAGPDGKSRRISLAGSSAALRWMDAQQQRAGTVTALVAKGDKPASTVPTPPPIPRVVRGPLQSQAGLSDTLPKSVLAKFPDDCDKSISADMRDPIIARLAPGVVLWGDVCSVAAYQSSYVMFLADEKGRNARPLVLTNGDGRKLEFPDIGFEYDPESMTLANFYKGRGLADCGGSSTWVWDGKAFRLTEETFMDLCRMLQPDAWPASYVTQDK